MPRPKKEKPNHGNLYEIKITIGKTLDGKLIRKSFYSDISKADAHKQAEQWKIDQAVAEQSGESFVTRDVTFGEWAMKWLDTYKKPNVRPNTFQASYFNPVMKHLIPFFGEARLRDIRPIDIQQFYNTRCAGLSQSLTHKITICLNGIFDAAIPNHLLILSPMTGIKPPTGKPSAEKQTYTQQQAEAVKEMARSHHYGLDILLMLELGLRRGEMLGLRWEDIDLDQKTVSVCQAVYAAKGKVYVGPPKTATSVRTLPISDDLAAYLKQKASSGYLVPNRYGDPLDPDNWRDRRFNAFMRDLTTACPDLPQLNPHELRHTCGTLLYERTHDIYLVSRYLGHSDVSITSKIYVHSSVDDMRKSLGL